MPESRRAYLHVGPPKTGTSYLQSVLWHSSDALRAQGYTVLPTPAGYGSSTQLMYAVRGRLKKDRDGSSGAEVLRRFTADARGAQTAHVIVTQEQLAGAGPKQVQRLYECLPDHEIHLLVTARSVARQIPSAWQERVKTRSVLAFDDYLRAVTEHLGDGAAFWKHQDLPEVLRRWGENLPPERVHVVTVPPPGSPADLLLARFCRALGVDPRVLPPVPTRRNSSLGHVQTEVLRRVNVALGDRLPQPRTGYARMAKLFLALRILKPQGGQPALMPGSAEQWCRDTTRAWSEAIDAAGYDVVGDLADLVPTQDHFATGSLSVGDFEVAQSAIEALASIITLRHEESMETDRLRARVAELEHEREASPLRSLLRQRRRRN